MRDLRIHFMDAGITTYCRQRHGKALYEGEDEWRHELFYPSFPGGVSPLALSLHLSLRSQHSVSALRSQTRGLLQRFPNRGIQRHFIVKADEVFHYLSFTIHEEHRREDAHAAIGLLHFRRHMA